MTLRERTNQGNRQSHATNSVCALTTTACATVDALRKSYTHRPWIRNAEGHNEPTFADGKLEKAPALMLLRKLAPHNLALAHSGDTKTSRIFCLCRMQLCQFLQITSQVGYRISEEMPQ